ncbi:uncharacterized protein LOC113385962 [Ctenocephalides felis]|uniref:uncharacterized protein LOC113385962 n=1 Tax=Ctenocephalides felis TaxID=7515 RepID=UPI000E6E1AB8|nr:uncharacterized protein LOC113385962 [Ctenocephalides felis]
MIGLETRGYFMHGMKCPNWTVFDKIQQYKEILVLEEKDREVSRYEKNKLERGEERHDQRRVWSTLANHERIQRAFGNHSSAVVSEYLQKENDHKRKQLDLLKYRKKQLMKSYRSLVSKANDLEDKVLVERAGIKTAIEKKRQLLALKVQNNSMRVIAAKYIFYSYEKILKILKKDETYYEIALNSLTRDSVDQSNLIVAATKMGQIATEHVDDLKNEYESIENDIRKNMAVRNRTLVEYRKLQEDLDKNIKILLPPGEQIYDIVESEPGTPPEAHLDVELNNFKTVLHELGQSIGVKADKEIMDECRRKKFVKEHLKIKTDDLKEKAHDLAKYANNSEILFGLVKHTYNQDKIAYLEKKKSLLSSIKYENQRRENAHKLNKNYSELLLESRNRFQHMKTLLTTVGDDKEIEESGAKLHSHMPLVSITHTQDLTEIRGENTEKFEDLSQVFTEVKTKLKLLHDNFEPHEKFNTCAELFYDRLTREDFACDQEVKLDLLEGISFEDAYIPTNASIKLESARIVRDNTIDELVVAAQEARARRRPGLIFRKYLREEKRRRKRNTCAL